METSSTTSPGEQKRSQGFWKNLKEKTVNEKRPIFILAPMADVTDAAFRRIIAKYSRHGDTLGGPDVFWSEFVSADGLASSGREALLVDLMFTENERPIVAQLFGSNPKNMEYASKLCAELGFDGIDLNMGCPDRSIEKQKAGAAHMKDYDTATLIINAVFQGIKMAGRSIPVSVKTRIGYRDSQIETWVPHLLKTGISALTIHARTRNEMSLVPAQWKFVQQAVEIRNSLNNKALIFGNGDVVSCEEGEQRVRETGCDGVMIGRGIFGNPWVFDKNKTPVTLEEKLRVMIEHTELFEELLGPHKNFAIMKKHYKAYVNGFNGAKELRVVLMEAKNAADVRGTVEEFLKSQSP